MGYAGRVSFFTSGSENVHFVEKLETGVRYAITISFTCNPDMAIPDPDTQWRGTVQCFTDTELLKDLKTFKCFFFC